MEVEDLHQQVSSYRRRRGNHNLGNGKDGIALLDEANLFDKEPGMSLLCDVEGVLLYWLSELPGLPGLHSQWYSNGACN